MQKAMLIVFILAFSIPGVAFPQSGAPQTRRIGILDSNQVAISFYDDGAMAGFNLGLDMRGEWPIGSGYFYISDMTPMLGLEIVDSRGDTIHPVIISRGPRAGQGTERNPIYGYFWGFNPLPGYIDTNQTSPAINTNPASWPSVWTEHTEWGEGVWNGFRGPNSFSTTLETYFKLTDQWDDEFNAYFKPDTSDTTINGYGITVGVRYFQSTDPLYHSSIIRLYDITNKSDYTYSKVVWGNITGSLSGGDGDSGDDIAVFDSTYQILYSGDYDCVGDEGQRVGYLAEAFIQTPGDGGFGSFRAFNIDASPDMSNDELLWSGLTPGTFVSTTLPQDCDYMYGCKYFSLAPGETKRVVSVVALGHSISEVTQEILDARALWASEFDTGLVMNSIKFVNLDYHRTLSGIENIQWTATRGGGTVDLWYSPDNGEAWNRIAKSQPNSGTYILTVDDIEDSPFGIFKIFIKDSLGVIYAFNRSHQVTVDGEMNGKPYIKILNSENYRNTEITDGSSNLELLIGDAEPGQLTVAISFSSDGGRSYAAVTAFTTASDTTSRVYPIPLHSVPNTDSAMIKVSVSDGISASFDTTGTFLKYTPRTALDTSMVKLISGICSIPYKVNRIDTTITYFNGYLLTFDDTTSPDQKYLTVRGKSSDINLVDREPLVPRRESSVFDGLSFYSEDTLTHLDVDNSMWADNDSAHPMFTFDRFVWALYGEGVAYNGIRLPCDYQIEFHPDTVGVSVPDTLYPPTSSTIISSKPVTFKVKNLSTGLYLDCVYWKTGVATTIHNIYFKEQVGGFKRRTWRCQMIYAFANAPLPSDDTLTIKTIKGLSFLDTIYVGIICDIPIGWDLPTQYKIEQNYPNPFNPSTKILYQLPENSHVVIKIYDILGREIKTLVDAVQPAGYRTVVWIATDVASGIYFYRLDAVNITGLKKSSRLIKKMIVLR